MKNAQKLALCATKTTRQKETREPSVFRWSSAFATVWATLSTTWAPMLLLATYSYFGRRLLGSSTPVQEWSSSSRRSVMPFQVLWSGTCAIGLMCHFSLVLGDGKAGICWEQSSCCYWTRFCLGGVSSVRWGTAHGSPSSTTPWSLRRSKLVLLQCKLAIFLFCPRLQGNPARQWSWIP